MIINKINKTKGFTLVELLVYIAGLLALGTVMIVLVVQFYGLYREIVAVPRADRVGLALVDVITKDIRSADQVNLSSSFFDDPEGMLNMDLVVDDVTTKKTYFVKNGIVKYSLDGGTHIPLSPTNFHVSNFNFTYVTTEVSEGIRFNLELQYQTKNATETKAYTGFAILRESYD